jgi:glucan phosphoethanolaminetransferase (alkaline phosphatase superfamily)
MFCWASSVQAARSVIAIALTAVLVACLIAGLARSWRVFFSLQLPLTMLGLAYAAYTIAFGMPPGRTLAGLLVGTSSEEVRGLIALPLARWSELFLIAWTACYVTLTLRLPSRPIFVGRAIMWSRALVILLIPITAYEAFNPSELIDGMSFNPLVGTIMFLAGDIPRARAEFSGSRVHKIPYQARRTGGEEVHVLVIGESERRDSWSAYGYQRTTTPYLNTLRNEAIFLQNARADANLTEWSVPIILTGMTPENFAIGAVRGNLLDLAREAKFTTAWLVNQDIGISGAVGVDPDYLEFPPDFGSNINGRQTLDEALLPACRRQVAHTGSARFIGIHMMGSHWEYYRRYPPNFRRFGSAAGVDGLSMVSVLLDQKGSESAVVDAYDNSVLYTDWFLEQIIEQLRALKVPATITYFPDHGEDLQLLDGSTGHGGPIYTQHAFEIPAFVWVNNEYRDAHPEIVAAMKNNATKEIRSHNVFYTLAELMGIRWPGEMPERSFASDRFVPDASMKLVAGGVFVMPPHSSPAKIGQIAVVAADTAANVR